LLATKAKGIRHGRGIVWTSFLIVPLKVVKPPGSY
jgi:hypothetical protein